MAEIVINDVKINYSCSGNKDRTVVLLHGWGQNSLLMAPIETHMAKYATVYNLDLPGFGLSSEPTVPYSVFDYANCLKAFMDKLAIEDPIIIAHSFGARLAIIYASENKVSKMILTGAAGIKDKRKWDYYLKVYTYKLIKKMLKVLRLKRYQEELAEYFGSDDYQRTSGVMRESFVKIVNEDLSHLLGKIQAEVLLVWGEKDDATPLWMAQLMEKRIPNAGLAVFANDDHYAYYHQMTRFLKVIDVFLGITGVN